MALAECRKIKEGGGVSRLYDQIAEHGLHGAGPDLLDLVVSPETVAVDVSNVADYIAGTFHAENHDKSWAPSDFPNIAPPWETAFFEWHPDFPEYRRELKRLGVFVIGLEWDDLPVPLGFEQELERLNEEPYWSVSCMVVLQRRGMMPHYMGAFGVLADRNGSVCFYSDSPDGDAPMFNGGGPLVSAAGQEGMGPGALVQIVAPALLGISFMHCKNVTKTLNDPPCKVQKKRLRKGKKPLKAYYTLGIDPVAQHLDREGGAKKTGVKQALHICRGHFATYSPEKPLFGKYSGTFWKPQHVKGNKKHGEIVKDYAVKAPRP